MLARPLEGTAQIRPRPRRFRPLELGFCGAVGHLLKSFEADAALPDTVCLNYKARTSRRAAAAAAQGPARGRARVLPVSQLPASSALHSRCATRMRFLGAEAEKADQVADQAPARGIGGGASRRSSSSRWRSSASGRENSSASNSWHTSSKRPSGGGRGGGNRAGRRHCRGGPGVCCHAQHGVLSSSKQCRPVDQPRLPLAVAATCACACPVPAASATCRCMHHARPPACPRRHNAVLYRCCTAGPVPRQLVLHGEGGGGSDPAA